MIEVTDRSQRPANKRAIRFAALAATVAGLSFATACQWIPYSSMPSTETVSLRVKGNVPDAQVTIDDIAIGALGYVAEHGVALPPGKHRITVEKAGYFPWDAVLVAQDEPIQLDVQLVPIPD